jgi:hypothetical protein
VPPGPSAPAGLSWPRRAVFPRPAEDAIVTGLGGRPIPVEQSGGRLRLARTMLIQLAEPFTSTSSESS